MRIGVIGAGISGLTAATEFSAHGHSVVLFDKARGVGGRSSIRRRPPFQFDHGAQYFTARDPEFIKFIGPLLSAGLVGEWAGRIVSTAGNGVKPVERFARYVGVPGMNAVAKHLATGLKVEKTTRISQLISNDGIWSLVDTNGTDHGEFDAIVLAMPSQQVSDLLATASRIDARVAQCELTPCWAVLLGFDRFLDKVPFDGAFVEDSSLSWIARNNSKPGRADAESWVLHASPDWSTDRTEWEREKIVEDLVPEFARIAGVDLGEFSPVHREAHLWRYAQPPQPITEGFIFGGKDRWIACGDWCHGARIEGAFLSGIKAARKLLSSVDME